MVTIKLKYHSTNEFEEFLFELRTQFSNLYRYSYNRLYEGLTKKEIYHSVSQLNNMKLIKSRMVCDSTDLASYLYKKDKKTITNQYLVQEKIS